MSGHRGGSRGMYARFVTVLSGGSADDARPCVSKWRFRASAIRRGSAERPTDNSPNSPRPYAESDLDTMNRYMVFQDAASDGASIDTILRDANDRRWLAGPAPALPSGWMGFRLTRPRIAVETTTGWDTATLRSVREVLPT